MKKYILDKEKLKKGKLYCLAILEPNEEIKFDLNKIVIFESDYYVDFEWFFDERENKIIPKNKYIKYKLGEYELKDGEYVYAGVEEIQFKEKPISEEPLKWNKKTKDWVIDEKAKKEIKKQKEKYLEEHYFEKIDSIKEEVLEMGFDFNGHNQKCRVRDLAFLNSTIDTLKDAKELFNKDITVEWAFNDNDSIKADLNTLKSIRLKGSPFIQQVFKVEKIFKSKKPFEITLSDFLNKLGDLNDL